MSNNITHITIHQADGTTQRFVPDAITPPEPPKPPAKKKRVGVNLDDIRYYGSARPFMRLDRGASPWFFHKNGGWNNASDVALDFGGDPVAFEPGVSGARLLQIHAGEPTGSFVITWDGPDDSTRVMGGHKTGVREWEFIRTDEKKLDVIHIHTEAPISNVCIKRLGDNTTSKFTREFTESCANFESLRFLGWHDTNREKANGEVFGSYNWCTYENAPVSVMAEACRAAKASAWLPVHHTATDEDLEELAEFEGVPLRIEHSNEVWNDSIGEVTKPKNLKQHEFARQASGDIHGDGWMRYHADRTAYLGRFARKLGIDTTCVLGEQAAGFHRFKYWLDKGHALAEDIDEIAIAPYFGQPIGRSTFMTRQELLILGVEGIIDECEKDIAVIRTWVKEWVKICQRVGKKLVGYEGGQHLILPPGDLHNDRELVQLFVDANRHPRMGELYVKFLDMWHDETDNSLICLLSRCDACPNEPWNDRAKWGSWGLMEYEGQRDAVKYSAVLDWLSK